MQRDQETPVQGLIELGQASVETRGLPGAFVEITGPEKDHMGLDD